MMVVRFRNNEEHEDLLKKIKRMRKFTEELEECLEEAYEEGEVNYRHEDEYEDEPHYRGGRYGYRRGSSRLAR